MSEHLENLGIDLNHSLDTELDKPLHKAFINKMTPYLQYYIRDRISYKIYKRICFDIRSQVMEQLIKDLNK